MRKPLDTIKCFISFEGDPSVGMFSYSIEIDTGLTEFDDDDKQFFVDNVIPAYHDLHDYGKMHFDFSDEWEKVEDKFRFRYVYPTPTYQKRFQQQKLKGVKK